MYDRQYAGEIKNFTGISDPYEIPRAPDLSVCGDVPADHIDKLANSILPHLLDRELITWR